MRDDAGYDPDLDETVKAEFLAKDGTVIDVAVVKLGISVNMGSLHVASDDEARRLIDTATTLRAGDGRYFQVVNMRRCPAINHMTPHLEFDFRGPFEKVVNG